MLTKGRVAVKTLLLSQIMETRAKIASGRRCAIDVVDDYLARISSLNATLLSYLHTSDERARHSASAIDAVQKYHPDILGALAGAPLSIKDLVDTAFAPTSYGNRHYANHMPSQSATVVKRLEREHAIILGKTHLHEFAFGVTNENAHFGPARNPVDVHRMTGGSSGGSAASVAAGLAFASIGTDTGGSIRIPASLTGVVGYKPSFGIVPTDGVHPLAVSLDHVGPITRTVLDAALLTDVMANFDDKRLSAPLRDETQMYRPIDIRVGIPTALIRQYASQDVQNWFFQLLDQLQHAHVARKTMEVELHGDEIGFHQGNVIGTQAYAVHAERLVATPEIYGEDVRERLVAGAGISAKEYMCSRAFQESFRKQLQAMFHEIDCILMPTTPITAPRIGETNITLESGSTSVRSLLTRFTNPWNLSGLPAISIPGGLIDGLPIGLQIIGPYKEDAHLLRMAAHIEYRLQDLVSA